jgi:hypothetical protein
MTVPQPRGWGTVVSRDGVRRSVDDDKNVIAMPEAAQILAAI